MSRNSGASLPVVEWSPSHPTPLGADSSVRVALSRRFTFIRTLRIPNVGMGDAERILRVQVPSVVPIPAPELVYAFRLTNDVGPEGRLASISAARAEVVRDLYKASEQAGTKILDIVPAAYGSQLLAQAMGLSDVAVVERDADGWSVDIVSGGELVYSRVLPLESDSRALQSEVERTFSMAGVPGGKVIASGGARIDFADHSSDLKTLDLLGRSEVAGLRVALELPERLQAREKTLINNRARLAVLLWAATLILAVTVLMDRMEDAQAVQKQQASFSKGSRDLKAARDLAVSRNTAINKTVETLERAFEPAQKASDVVSLVSSLTPPNIWLTGMTFDRGKPVQLRGTALDGNAVANYLDLLSGQDRFRDVKLVFANDASIETTQVSQFSISLHAIGNLPLTDPKKKTVKR